MQDKRWATNFFGLVAQMIMHNIFQDIASGVAKVERASVEPGKEALILAVFAEQGHTVLYPAFRLVEALVRDRKGEMIEDVLRRLLEMEAGRARLAGERVRCLCYQRQPERDVIEGFLRREMTSVKRKFLDMHRIAF